jgi:predicted RNase H-like nuclease (RuvC/YqgF family)
VRGKKIPEDQKARVVDAYYAGNSDSQVMKLVAVGKATVVRTLGEFRAKLNSAARDIETPVSKLPGKVRMLADKNKALESYKNQARETISQLNEEVEFLRSENDSAFLKGVRHDSEEAQRRGAVSLQSEINLGPSNIGRIKNDESLDQYVNRMKLEFMVNPNLIREFLSDLYLILCFIQKRDSNTV